MLAVDVFGDSRCSVTGLGSFKSTLYVQISNVCNRDKSNCSHKQKYNLADDVSDKSMTSNLSSNACKICGKLTTAGKSRETKGFQIKTPGPHDRIIYGPSVWSTGLFDPNNNALMWSNMRLQTVREGISLCVNVRRCRENVDSVLVYSDLRRYKNQILVFPGLCPCPSTFAETSFTILSNTYKRFKNRIQLHNRQFKTTRHSETVCIVPKTVHKNYTTTLNYKNINSYPPAAWHETTLEFVPRKYRSVYHIGLSNSKGRDNPNPNPPQKFTLKKWQFAELNKTYNNISSFDVNINEINTATKRMGKNRQGYVEEECGQVETLGVLMKQSNPNQVIITNVLSNKYCSQEKEPSPNIQAKHQYFTLEQT